MQIDYFAIDRRLIVSAAACRFHRLAAWISLIVTAGILAGCFTPGTPAWLGPFAPPLLMTGILAYVSNVSAMEVFLFRFDETGAVKQIFWFLVTLVPLLGAPVYCLVAYSRSNAVKSIEVQRAST